MYFNYQMGRVYYTLEDDSRPFYRYFTPGTEFFGNAETGEPAIVIEIDLLL